MGERETPPAEVFLVDDEKEVTDGLAWLLESVRISSRAFSSASAFLSFLATFDGVACAVLDLRMPEMSGLELQHLIQETGHALPIIFLSAHGDVPAAVNAMQAGAVDFLQKPFNPDQFLTSVRRAIRLAEDLHAQRATDLKLRDKIEQLSSREQEVLAQLLDGRISKEIAVSLGISHKTVDVHRANVMRKLGVSSSVELMRSFGQHPMLRGAMLPTTASRP